MAIGTGVVCLVYAERDQNGPDGDRKHGATRYLPREFDRSSVELLIFDTYSDFP